MAYWDRTKNNRLKKPAGVKLNFSTFDEENPNKITMYGQPFPEVGDYVFVGNTPSGGTVGKVLSYTEYECHGGPAIEIEMLSGEVKTEWVTYALVLDYAAVQEVKDFYIADGRPERIKVSW
jgi:hypothetical protein